MDNKKEYTMDNRLCDGRTPEIKSQEELLNFRNRLTTDADYRNNFTFELAKTLNVVNSRISSCLTDVYFGEVVDYITKLLANNSILPKTHKITLMVKFEDEVGEEIEEEYDEEPTTSLATDGERELLPLYGSYYVLNGSYIAKASFNELYDTDEQLIELNDESGDEIEVTLTLRKKPASI